MERGATAQSLLFWQQCKANCAVQAAGLCEAFWGTALVVASRPWATYSKSLNGVGSITATQTANDDIIWGQYYLSWKEYPVCTCNYGELPKETVY